MTTQEIQQGIIEDFSVLEGDLEMTLNYLIELGEDIQLIDEELKTDDRLVKGCQSKVWLECKKIGEIYKFYGDSNTSITKGLLSILIRIFNEKSQEEIINTSLFFIERIGLNRFIGTQRSNGLQSMEKKFKLLALKN